MVRTVGGYDELVALDRQRAACSPCWRRRRERRRREGDRLQEYHRLPPADMNERILGHDNQVVRRFFALDTQPTRTASWT